MIRCDREAGLCLLTLDRPEKANALTAGMLESLAGHVVANGDAQVLILTGAGRVFSAGADLDAVQDGLATSPLWERVSGAIAAFPGLSIAALNGSLAGGAFGMALACDLRIAVPGAGFFYPVMQRGYLPQPSDPARLVAMVGPARAKLLLLGGERWTADQALRFGLLEEIADDPVTRARELAAQALATDPAHVAAIKAMI